MNRVFLFHRYLKNFRETTRHCFSGGGMAVWTLTEVNIFDNIIG